MRFGDLFIVPAPAEARAEIVVFKNGRTMSAKSPVGRRHGRRWCCATAGKSRFRVDRRARRSATKFPVDPDPCANRRRSSCARRGRPHAACACQPLTRCWRRVRSRTLISTVAWSTTSIRPRACGDRAGIELSARARSQKGARGLMQLMPATARQYGVRNSLRSEVESRGRRPPPQVAAEPARPAGGAGRV